MVSCPVIRPVLLPLADCRVVGRGGRSRWKIWIGSSYVLAICRSIPKTLTKFPLVPGSGTPVGVDPPRSTPQ
eukprot:11992239-Ditylum_brightwellii.AAC.1